MAVKRQQFANSCGAASLLCAAIELGVPQIPFNPTYTLWLNGPTPLASNNVCETALYQVTSNNPGNINAAGWGYSMPSNVVRCARMLGLQAWAVAYRTWTVRGLKIGYRDELDALRMINALAEPGGSWRGSNHSTLGLLGHQRELKVLMGRGRHNFGGLHYVMVRPDRSVMEPGAGADYPAVDNAKTAVNMHGTGLSIFVQR